MRSVEGGALFFLCACARHQVDVLLGRGELHRETLWRGEHSVSTVDARIEEADCFSTRVGERFRAHPSLAQLIATLARRVYRSSSPAAFARDPIEHEHVLGGEARRWRSRRTRPCQRPHVPRETCPTRLAIPANFPTHRASAVRIGSAPARFGSPTPARQKMDRAAAWPSSRDGLAAHVAPMTFHSTRGQRGTSLLRAGAPRHLFAPARFGSPSRAPGENGRSH